MFNRKTIAWGVAATAFAAQVIARQRAKTKGQLSEPDPEWLESLIPTLGGKQFWADERWFRDFRIQRNAFINRYRLLDPANQQLGSGTYEDCNARLEEIIAERNLPPLSGKAVVVLHGLFRTRSSGVAMARYLAEQGGYTAFTIGYPSTRADVDTHADCLGRVLSRLHGIERIDLVAHSLGNIVIRRYLARQTDPHTQRQGDPRLGRFVMVGAPNSGARLAEMFGRTQLFKTVFGPSAVSLGHGWKELCPLLAIPQMEFGIIAGGRGSQRGFNPLLSGDDDLVVRVSETMLPGAHDFLVLPTIHTIMMNRPELQAATLRFLREGHFVSAEQRHPLPQEESPFESATGG